MIWQNGDGFGKFQENFALNFAFANSFAARGAASAPLFDYKAVKIKGKDKKTIFGTLKQ